MSGEESRAAFISYRRDVAGILAMALYQHLTERGIDTFYDIEALRAGQFDIVILNQIAARPYFLLVLTPGTLERCQDPGDWLRREIEHAVTTDRVIVPVHTPNFNYEDADRFLLGGLGREVRRFNGLELPQKWFKFAVQQLVDEYLVPVQLTGPVVPAADQAVVDRMRHVAQAASPVTALELSAQQYVERALTRSTDDLDGMLADYDAAILRNPRYADAFNRRGVVRRALGDLDGAIADFQQGARIAPDDDSFPKLLREIQEQRSTAARPDNSGPSTIALLPAPHPEPDTPGGPLRALGAQPRIVFPHPDEMVSEFAFSSDGRLLATGSSDDMRCTARIFEVADARELKVLHHPQVYTSPGAVVGVCVALSPDGRLLATGSWHKVGAIDRGIVRIWKVESGDELLVLDHPEAVYSLAFSPDGGLLAAGGGHGYMSTRIWEVESGNRLLVLKRRSQVNSLAFSPNGLLLATGSQDKTARIWKVDGGEEIRALKHPGQWGSVESVAFSPDGRLLATGSYRAARIWEVESGIEMKILKHPGMVFSVAFSPDGRLLATFANDELEEESGALRVWEVDSGKEAQMLKYPGFLWQVAFSPDGHLLAACGESAVSAWMM